MKIGVLGKVYEPGEPIVSEGEVGECMYIVQQGEVEVVVTQPEGEVQLSVLGAGEPFGEMALFTRQRRSATVRARGKARVMTIDKRGFMKRVHEDPSLAFRILEKMSERIAILDEQIARLQSQ